MDERYVIALTALKFCFEVFRYFNDRKKPNNKSIVNEKKSPEQESGDLNTENK